MKLCYPRRLCCSPCAINNLCLTSQKTFVSSFVVFKKSKFNHWPFISEYLRGEELTKAPVFQDREATETPVPGCYTKTNFIFGLPVPETPLHTFFGWIYRIEPVCGRNSSPGLGRNTVRFGKSAPKYPWGPRNVWSEVSAAGIRI